MQFFGFLLINTLFTVITAIIIYYFSKVNFKLEINKSRILIFILSFGIVNGIVASLWTNLFKISSNMQSVKQILLLILSIVIIKFSLNINWLKSLIAFIVLMLSTGVGSALIPTILNVTVEEALSSVSTYLIVNIVIYVIAMVILAILQLFIKLALIIVGKTNPKHTTD